MTAGDRNGLSPNRVIFVVGAVVDRIRLEKSDWGRGMSKFICGLLLMSAAISGCDGSKAVTNELDDAAAAKTQPFEADLRTASPNPVKRVFACSLGLKQVTVTLNQGNLRYQFGRPGKPEITLEGNAQSGNVFYSGGFGTLDYSQQLRFANGRISYVLSDNGLRSDFDKGTPGNSALTVWDSGRRIARLECKTGGGFTNIEALIDLPEDNTDLGEE